MGKESAQDDSKKGPANGFKHFLSQLLCNNLCKCTWGFLCAISLAWYVAWPIFYGRDLQNAGYVAYPYPRSIGYRTPMTSYPNWVFTRLPQATDGERIIEASNGRKGAKGGARRRSWMGRHGLTKEQLKEAADDDYNQIRDDDSDDNTSRQEIPNLRTAFTITGGWFKYGWDETAYRLRIGVNTDVLKPEYNYIGYQYSGIYRYTRLYNSKPDHIVPSDDAVYPSPTNPDNYTYSLSLTPWADWCEQNTPPSPATPASLLTAKAFPAFPYQNDFMSCERAKVCDAAGKEVHAGANLARNCMIVYLVFTLVGTSLLFGIRHFILKGKFENELRYGILGLCIVGFICQIVTLINSIHIHSRFEDCTEGLDAYVQQLNLTPGYIADNDDFKTWWSWSWKLGVLMLILSLYGVWVVLLGCLVLFVLRKDSEKEKDPEYEHGLELSEISAQLE